MWVNLWVKPVFLKQKSPINAYIPAFVRLGIDSSYSSSDLVASVDPALAENLNSLYTRPNKSVSIKSLYVSPD
jgi:hypothetical protein